MTSWTKHIPDLFEGINTLTLIASRQVMGRECQSLSDQEPGTRWRDSLTRCASSLRMATGGPPNSDIGRAIISVCDLVGLIDDGCNGVEVVENMVAKAREALGYLGIVVSAKEWENLAKTTNTKL